jgi:hypothetical protein
LAQLEEPTAAWLFMSCLAARWGLPKPVKKDFDARLKEALRGPANGRTAGRMARYLLPLLQRRVKSTEYVGRATHQRLVVDYLRRCRNVRWEREDLRAVCEFLTTDEGWRTQSLLREFVALGVKQFPNEPLFHYLAGESEMKQGPLMVNAEVAQRCLQRALDLDRQDGGSLGASFRDRAKQSLALLDSLSHTARGMFDDEDDEDYEDWEYFDEDDEEDDYDEDYGPGSGFSGRYYSEDELRRALPPPMFEILKQQAQQMGVSIGELASRIGQFASQFGSGQEDYDDEDFGPPRRGRRRPVRR